MPLHLYHFMRLWDNQNLQTGLLRDMTGYATQMMPTYNLHPS